MELTNYFLNRHYEDDLTTTAVLGSGGRLVLAYAKLLNEMWHKDEQSVRPTMFKKILGQYAQEF